MPLRQHSARPTGTSRFSVYRDELRGPHNRVDAKLDLTAHAQVCGSRLRHLQSEPEVVPSRPLRRSNIHALWSSIRRTTPKRTRRWSSPRVDDLTRGDHRAENLMVIAARRCGHCLPQTWCSFSPRFCDARISAVTARATETVTAVPEAPKAKKSAHVSG